MGFPRQEYWSGMPLPSPKEEITQNEIIRGHSKVWASKGGSEGWALQCGRPGFDPWVGKIPWRRIQAAYSSILAWRSPWSPWAHKQTQLSDFHFQFSRVYSTHRARLNVASYFVAYDNEDKMD